MRYALLGGASWSMPGLSSVRAMPPCTTFFDLSARFERPPGRLIRFPCAFVPGALLDQDRKRATMSFKDLEAKSASPHVDTPAQAEARAQALADVKAKADAKAVKAAAKREGKPKQDPAKPGPAAKGPKPEGA
jgi:hypothetical protein